MTGKWITHEQKRVYMKKRKEGDTQEIAAAKCGISLRSAQRIESKQPKTNTQRSLHNSRDPFNEVWESELVPLLQENPKLQAISLLCHLQMKYTGQYPDSLLRTLQRRVRDWKTIYGPQKEIIFRQKHPPGWQGMSDFTACKSLNVTIKGEPLEHTLYHFWLPFSTWESASVIIGGESYPALAESFQVALWSLGGVPHTHRTDSLSAAYKNLNKDAAHDFTKAYKALCLHYGTQPTRNNKDISHENGSVEVAHKHLKQRLDQALMIRGSRDFEDIEAYRAFVDEVVARHNSRIRDRLAEERKSLLPLPKHKTGDFDLELIRVPSTSVVTIRDVRYSVPSNLIGSRLAAHLYDARIELYLGATHIMTLERLRRNKGARPFQINYRHLIHGLVRKPQAFRNYQYRDYLFPTHAFKVAWEQLDQQHDNRRACKEYVNLLQLAADYSEEEISSHIEHFIEAGKLPQASDVAQKLGHRVPKKRVKVTVEHSELSSYNQLLKGEL